MTAISNRFAGSSGCRRQHRRATAAGLDRCCHASASLRRTICGVGIALVIASIVNVVLVVRALA